MSDRRSLIDGLKQTASAVDPKLEKDFVFRAHKPSAGKGTAQPALASAPTVVSRSPISTRIRADFAAALKRASLERQLKGIEPYTLQDILEEAIEPWLRGNGYC